MVKRVGIFVVDGVSYHAVTLAFSNKKVMAFVKYEPGKETLALLREGDEVQIRGTTAQGDENLFVEDVEVNNLTLQKETS